MKNKLTIVGPEPEKHIRIRSNKSLHMEAFLLMAKYNKKFRKTLIKNPDKAISQSGIHLSENEKLLLTSMNSTQLLNLIKVFQVNGITKKSLSNWKVAATIILLLSTFNLSEGNQPTKFLQKSVYNKIISHLFNQQEVYAVTGVVTDQNGEPLPGISIVIKGTSNGTATNIDGEYTIKVTSNDILVFTFLGMVTQEIEMQGNTEINVTMIEDVANLDDVVVISYGITPDGPSNVKRFYTKSKSERRKARKERQKRKARIKK